MKTDAVLNRWLECAAHRPGAARFAVAPDDPFRNPVEYTLRENLSVLLEQVLGSMDAGAVQAALENVSRIRAVQDLTASQAVQFVFALRSILRAGLQDADFERIDANIDRLALGAFDEYARCRERIAELRISESRRAIFAAALLGSVDPDEPARKEPVTGA